MARRCPLGDADPYLLLDAEMELANYCQLFGRDRCIIVEAVRQIGSGCAVIVMMPCALRYNAGDSTFEVVGDEPGTKKLEAYYRRLGFRKLRDLLYFDNRLQMVPAAARPGRGGARAV